MAASFEPLLPPHLPLPLPVLSAVTLAQILCIHSNERFHSSSYLKESFFQNVLTIFSYLCFPTLGLIFNEVYETVFCFEGSGIYGGDTETQ